MAPPPPAVALEIFGERIDIAVRYAELLAGEGVARGLIGPREAERLWERHLLNCAVIESAFDRSWSVCDIGSGAGLPGVVLALVRPDLELTLVEPLLRRSVFLEQVVQELGLEHVRVIRSRAEDLVGEVLVDAATARAVAPLERLAKWCLPIVKPGGLVVAIKGAGAERELEAAHGLLDDLGAARWSVEEFGSGLIYPPTRAVVIEAGSPVRQARSGKKRPQRRRPRRLRG